MLRVLCALTLLAAPLTAQEHDIAGPVAVAVFTSDAEPVAELLRELLYESIENGVWYGEEASWLLRLRVDYRERPSLIGPTDALVLTYALLPITDDFETVVELMTQNSREIAPDRNSLEAVVRLIAAEVKVHMIELRIEREEHKLSPPPA